MLIRAMRQVDAHLLIIGIGPMREAWQELARMEGLTDKLTFLGECSDRESLAARYAADLFVLPSTNRAEALGIVQLEAMACGLPVLCTELGTGTSYVNQHEKTGLVVPPNDPQALAAAINRLLADPALRAQMGAAGRKTSAEGVLVANHDPKHDLILQRGPQRVTQAWQNAGHRFGPQT